MQTKIIDKKLATLIRYVECYSKLSVNYQPLLYVITR